MDLPWILQNNILLWILKSTNISSISIESSDCIQPIFCSHRNSFDNFTPAKYHQSGDKNYHTLIVCWDYAWIFTWYVNRAIFNWKLNYMENWYFCIDRRNRWYDGHVYRPIHHALVVRVTLMKRILRKIYENIPIVERFHQYREETMSVNSIKLCFWFFLFNFIYIFFCDIVAVMWKIKIFFYRNDQKRCLFHSMSPAGR